MDDISAEKQHRNKKHKTKVHTHTHTPLVFWCTHTHTPPSSSLTLHPSLQVGNEGLASEDDADTEEALKEFDFLVTAEDGEGAGEARSSGDGTEWGERLWNYSNQSDVGFLVRMFSQSDAASTERVRSEYFVSVAEPLPFAPGSGKSFLLGGSDDVLESVLGLGDLADLTVTNDEADYSYDVSHAHTILSRCFLTNINRALFTTAAVQ